MKLAAIVPMLIPVKKVKLDVLVHETTAYKLLNEHILRAIDAGLSESVDIANFLGVERELVSEGLAEELREGTVAIDDAGEFHVTSLGASTLANLVRVEARKQAFKVGEDGITEQIVSLSDCLDKAPDAGQAVDRHQVAPVVLRKGPLNPRSIDLVELNGVLQLGEDRRVIRVDSTRREAKPVFRECFALVYTDVTLSRREVDLVIDDEISQRHSRAIDPDDFIAAIDLKLDSAIEPPSLIDALGEVRAIQPAAAAAIVQAVQSVEIVEGVENVEDALKPAGQGMFKVQDRQPSRVTVYEHRDILIDATLWATDRLMIFSPWIKSGVVNRGFLKRLEKLLERGVRLTIVYGIGDASDNSEWSISQLCDLASRFTNFDFLRHKNTHAKAFIVDDCVIQTSFNWLSFAGDEKRTYRMEEGMKFVGAELATSFYEAYQALLDEEAELACS